MIKRLLDPKPPFIGNARYVRIFYQNDMCLLHLRT